MRGRLSVRMRIALKHPCVALCGHVDVGVLRWVELDHAHMHAALIDVTVTVN